MAAVKEKKNNIYPRGDSGISVVQRFLICEALWSFRTVSNVSMCSVSDMCGVMNLAEKESVVVEGWYVVRELYKSDNQFLHVKLFK